VRDCLIEFLDRRRVNREIQTNPEQPGLATGDSVGHLGRVVGRGLGHRIGQAALLGVAAPVGFEPGPLPA
jgi:hypothetical protein